jgi:hypothetical protein
VKKRRPRPPGFGPKTRGKATDASGPSQPEIAAATTTKPASEQSTNIDAAGAISPGPARASLATPTISKPDGATARETLRVGARVLAAYWNEKREFEGFWLATVKRIEPGEYGSGANGRIWPAVMSAELPEGWV